MSVWHGDSHKKKPSGGRKRAHRKKRRFERGSFPAETKLGERKGKIIRRRGGGVKVRLLSERNVNISTAATGKTERTEVLRVIRNPANVDYDRRRVITKGTIIQTKLGLARVTSRPGQDGLLNAMLVPEKAEK
ncbi:MAG: 30S ribosomal protein S8e [Candidatus Bathyarchaeota archaeon]|jgi:small subunit ribosomal protein S8e|nr:30S ribosomal protein S8e [Candidatus Bathyarchaeota archaeon]